jgi:hypothetical protein
MFIGVGIVMIAYRKRNQFAGEGTSADLQQ